MGTLTVLACSFFTAGHTFGNIAGQLLELFTCAPSTRNGAPSTISAERPSRVTTSGNGCAACAAPVTTTPNNNICRIRIVCLPSPRVTSIGANETHGSPHPDHRRNRRPHHVARARGVDIEYLAADAAAGPRAQHAAGFLQRIQHRDGDARESLRLSP